MKKEMTPDWDALKDRKDYWVTLFGRLKPGTHARTGDDVDQHHLSAAAAAGHRAPLQRPKPRRSSDIGQEDRAEARGLRPRPAPRAGQEAALAAAGDDLPGAADCLRQRREPAAHARARALARNRGAAGARRVPRGSWPAVCCSNRASSPSPAPGWGSRSRTGRCAASSRRCRRGRSVPSVLTAGLDGRMLLFALAPRGGHQRHLRPLSGAAGVEGAADLRPPRSERTDDGEPVDRILSQGARHAPDGDLAAAARLGGPVRQDAAEPVARRSRPPPGSPDDLLADSEVERLHRRARRRSSISSCASVSPRCPASRARPPRACRRLPAAIRAPT